MAVTLAIDVDGLDLSRLSQSEVKELLRLAEQVSTYERQRQFFRLFPDENGTGPDGQVIHSRHKYPKHLEFFEAGATYRERCFLAANRVGKTVSGAYEVSCHLTGLYPDWWHGCRFSTPVRFWAAGKTNETTRDIVQAALLGDIAYQGQRKVVSGTGLVPGYLLGSVTWKQGVADLVDTIKVKHVSGRWSTLGVKSYQQGRGAFEGTAQHGIWLDEEPPIEIYGECLTRTATVNGVVMITFTPLDGVSETVMQFLPKNQRTQ